MPHLHRVVELFFFYQTIDVNPSANGTAVIHRKKSSSPRAVRSAYASTVIGTRTGPRRALGIAAQPSKRGYRPDLRRVSLCLNFSIHTRLVPL